jgi:seryl-tRNA synthetase
MKCVDLSSHFAKKLFLKIAIGDETVVMLAAVVRLDSNSSILKEEVKKRVCAEQGIKTTVAPAEKKKDFERQLRGFQSLFQNTQESIGNLEVSCVLKRMDDRACKTAVARMNDETDRLRTKSRASEPSSDEKLRKSSGSIGLTTTVLR